MMSSATIYYSAAVTSTTYVQWRMLHCSLMVWTMGHQNRLCQNLVV